MAEPKEPREPRIPKESPPFDADNKWTRTWIMYFESLFRLSVKEAVRQTLEVAVTHSGDLTKDLPVFGDDAAVIKVGTKSGNTNKVVTNTGTNVTGNTVKWDASGNLIDAGTAPGGGSGTVTHTGGALTADLPVFGAGSADIKVGTKSGNTNKLVSNTGTNVTGNTVKWDASGNLIDAGSAPGGGSGTVTSVALTVPAEFSVSGSPVTTSGTLAVSKATQSANTVYAGPTTGSAAAPTFRAVVPADLPLASSSAFGAVKVDGTTITAASGVISAVGGGSSGGVIGTANFSMATGAITKLHTGGVISGVTFLSTGKFRVTLSPSQTNFSVSFSASDDNTTAMMIYFAGTPDFSVATASFDVYTFGYSGNTARNFVQVTVMIAQL